MSLLRLEALSKRFGDHWALKEIDFSIDEGEIVGLVGPNGAGKTTLFNLITCRHRATSGRILFANKETTLCKPHEIQKLGISRTFQSSRPFAKMSTLDNVVVGRVFGGEFHLFAQSTDIDSAKQLLELVGLAHKEQTPAGDLTLSEQRRLDLARALATEAPIILLDEPTSALDILHKLEIMELLTSLRNAGKTILISIHDLDLARRYCDTVTLLQQGCVHYHGMAEKGFAEQRIKEVFHVGVEEIATEHGVSLLFYR